MTKQDLISRMEGRFISQICGASSDIQRTIANWTKLMNVGPWLVLNSSPATISNLLANNKPLPENADFHSYCALASLGNVQLEFNQPLWGDDALPAFLDANGESWHHFKEHITPADAVLQTGREYLETKGLDIVSYGEIDQDRYLNVGTYAAVGVNLELGNTGRIQFPPEYQRNYPEGDHASSLAEKSRQWHAGELIFVTDHLENALSAWVKYLQVGPWRIQTIDDAIVSDVVMDGHAADGGKFRCRIGRCRWGDKRLTVIERGYGIAPVAEYAFRSKRGMFAVSFQVDPGKFDAKVAYFAERGIPVRLGGRLFGERFALLDTESILGVRIALSDFAGTDDGVETTFPAF
ncbi:MAG: VOC family protein [Victivallaceae bacterium]|nr:VOC family protein [Victivallaceae bacterium]